MSQIKSIYYRKWGNCCYNDIMHDKRHLIVRKYSAVYICKSVRKKEGGCEHTCVSLPCVINIHSCMHITCLNLTWAFPFPRVCPGFKEVHFMISLDFYRFYSPSNWLTSGHREERRFDTEEMEKTLQILRQVTSQTLTHIWLSAALTSLKNQHCRFISYCLSPTICV